MAAHPQHHVADHHHGDGTHHRLEALLLALGKVGRDDLQRHADGDADGHGDGHPDPYLPEGVASTLLTEEGGNDADDEGGLHPLSQSDDERRQH